MCSFSSVKNSDGRYLTAYLHYFLIVIYTIAFLSTIYISFLSFFFFSRRNVISIQRNFTFCGESDIFLIFHFLSHADRSNATKDFPSAKRKKRMRNIASMFGGHQTSLFYLALPFPRSALIPGGKKST